VAVLPAAVAVVTMPAAAAVGLVLAVFIGTLGGLLVAGEAGSRPGDPARVAATRRAALRSGAMAFAAWLVGIGLLVLLGPVGWIVVLLIALAVGSRWWVHRRRAIPGRVAVSDGPIGFELPAPQVAALSTPQLCLAWRHSAVALLDTPPGPARDELVRIRGCLLDELERRDREGFVRWLEAGARAGSDPTRYLTAEGGG
jgi:hypothetical protein